VLALFLTTVVASVACADHDLADAGIGQHQSHMPAPDDSGSGGPGSAAHAFGHCCHSGGTHAPALATIVDVLPISSLACISVADEPTRPSAMAPRELRPPIH
jgi:hypothetical protein